MKKLFFLAVFALFPLGLFAQNDFSDLMKAVPNDPDVRIGTLANGAKYYIRHNDKEPNKANFHIVYEVGAVNENDNQQGLAHFLEHLAFRGTKHYPTGALDKYLKSIGVSGGGGLNAHTAREHTMYEINSVPTTRESIIDSVLLVLYDWSGNIDINEKEVEEERHVILEEYRMREDMGWRLGQKISPVLYGDNRYGTRNIIGTRELLSNYSRDDVREFYQKWYRPDRAAYVIVGDIDVDMVESKIISLMSDVPKATEALDVPEFVFENTQGPEIAVITDPEMPGSQFMFAFRQEPIPAEYNNTIASYKFGVINSLITRMFSARTEEIVLSGDCPFAGVSASYHKGIELAQGVTNVRPIDRFMVSGVSRSPQEVNEAIKLAYTELLRASKGGFTESELGRAVENYKSNAERRYNNRNDVKNVSYVYDYVTNFLENSSIPSAEYEFELTKYLLDNTSVEEVNAVLGSYIKDMNSAIIVFAPESTSVPSVEEIKSVIEEVNSSEIIPYVDDVINEPLVDTETLKGGKIIKEEDGKFDSKVLTLDNGLKVVLKHTDLKQEEVLMFAVKQGGTSTISDNDLLFASEVYGMYALMEGVGNFSATDLQKLLTGKTAATNVGIDEYNVDISGMSVPKDIETLFQLTYLRIMQPRFSEQPLNTIKNYLLNSLPLIITTPNYLFEQELLLTSYENTDRLQTQLLNVDLLTNLTLQQIEDIYKATIADASGFTFIFVGNFDEEAIKPLIELYLGSLPVASPTTKYGEYSDIPVKGEINKRFRTPMETPKTTVHVQYRAEMGVDDDVRANVRAIQYILRNRYYKSIREEAGGSYSVGVSPKIEYIPKEAITLVVQFDTDESKVDDLIPIVYKELEDLANNGATDEILSEIREYYTSEFNRINTENAVWGQYLKSAYLWGRDTYTNYLRSLNNVTSESIKSVMKQIVSQGNRITLVHLPEAKTDETK